jgi:CrcB protein
VTRVVLVGAGGLVGSVLRYVVSGLVQDAARDSLFPWGTLAVNVLGCLAIGVLGELAEARGAFGVETRALLMTGLLGGFTTFSAWAIATRAAPSTSGSCCARARRASPVPPCCAA